MSSSQIQQDVSEMCEKSANVAFLRKKGTFSEASASYTNVSNKST